ncbi:ABC transporter permease subunit [Candidatus Micrarchaeota archaeon]|nr:ABC transporter permease subunit [Candidatus Micrarchaeota archaeon]
MVIKLKIWQVAAILALLFALFFIGRAGFSIEPKLLTLPILAFYSLYRMLIAYLAALVFAILYGYYAATRLKTGKILVPVLDVLQSIPILGFFPAAIFFFVNAFQGNVIGIEIASIFLIFTSMAWNMTFGVYEAIIGIPKDISNAVSAFGMKKFLRFKNLILPATVPKLVYNSMVSWAGGWYFLLASEIISLGSNTHKLPGIGSYLLETISKGNLADSFAGLAVLIVIIISMDLMIWRPLSIWAEKFKYDSGYAQRPKSMVYRFYKWSPAMTSTRKMLTSAFNVILDDLERINDWFYSKNKESKTFRMAEKLIRYAVLLVVFGIAAELIWSIMTFSYSIASNPIPKEAIEIPKLLLLSLIRLLAAFAISFIWTVPTAIYIMRNRDSQKYLIPFFEIAAAIPAPALFPAMILLALTLTGSLEFASILLITTGMQWYILFNAMAGVKSLPNDIDEAAESFGVGKLLYYRRVLIPAMLPSLITGSVIAFGGGWNALVVAEFVKYSGCENGICQVEGIGAFISGVTYSTTISPEVQAKLLFLGLFAMVLMIFAINHFFWRRIYRHVMKRYRLDG